MFMIVWGVGCGCGLCEVWDVWSEWSMGCGVCGDYGCEVGICSGVEECGVYRVLAVWCIGGAGGICGMCFLILFLFFLHSCVPSLCPFSLALPAVSGKLIAPSLSGGLADLGSHQYLSVCPVGQSGVTPRPQT